MTMSGSVARSERSENMSSRERESDATDDR